MSFPSEQRSIALATRGKMRVNGIIHPLSENCEENNPTHRIRVCCMLIVPSYIHLHNGAAKKGLLILLMQLDYCLSAFG